MTAAWKDLERRICVALGGRRAGPIGASVSDCVNVPFAVEIKRSSRPGPPVLSKWITQARTNSRKEHLPWLVVVAGHNDRRPIIALDFWEFVELAQLAGRVPIPVLIDDNEDHRPRRPTMSEAETSTETEVAEPEPQPDPEPEPDNGDDGEED